MKSSIIVWSIVLLIALAGGVYWWTAQTAVSAPQGAMGINGSPNQGNMGQPDSGAVQQPMANDAEGSIVGDNLGM